MRQIPQPDVVILEDWEEAWLIHFGNWNHDRIVELKSGDRSSIEAAKQLLTDSGPTQEERDQRLAFKAGWDACARLFEGDEWYESNH